MSSAIPPAVAQVLQARQSAMNQQLGIEILAKQLDATQASGDAINRLLESVATAQKQIANGHLDVRV